MSTRRIAIISTVPQVIKEVFRRISSPRTPEEHLWRERAARMTLDALGYTNLTVKPDEHNETVRYARRWFKRLYVNHPDIAETDDPDGTFDCGGVPFIQVRDTVLATEPILFEIPDTDED